jgi:hypothetical protein
MVKVFFGLDGWDGSRFEDRMDKAIFGLERIEYSEQKDNLMKGKNVSEIMEQFYFKMLGSFYMNAPSGTCAQ